MNGGSMILKNPKEKKGNPNLLFMKHTHISNIYAAHRKSDTSCI